MIRPEGFRGAAFGTAADGDARHDAASRIAMSERLGISTEWATIHQVHGSTVLRVAGPGFAGDADGLITETPGVPLVVATADCVPVIVEGGHTTAVVHAGWRGVAARVLERAVEVMVSTGDRPLRVAVGPAIGPCCYEVGAEVVAAIDGFTGTTSWGTRSVDLRAALAEQAGDVEVWRSERCTYTDESLHSYRENATTARQVAVTWLPSD